MDHVYLGYHELFRIRPLHPVLRERYASAILVAKAGQLRRQTKNWGIHAKQEEVEVDFHELLTNNFSRPTRLLSTIYMSFIYGLLYVFLSAYPIVFQGVYGMDLGVGGLPFFGLVVGQLLAGLYILLIQGQYNRKLVANHNVPIPEWRLWSTTGHGRSCLLCWRLVLVSPEIEIFRKTSQIDRSNRFGWTGFTRSIYWMAPTASGVLTGFGILCIFLRCFNYIIDSYLMS